MKASPSIGLQLEAEVSFNGVHSILSQLSTKHPLQFNWLLYRRQLIKLLIGLLLISDIFRVSWTLLVSYFVGTKVLIVSRKRKFKLYFTAPGLATNGQCGEIVCKDASHFQWTNNRIYELWPFSAARKGLFSSPSCIHPRSSQDAIYYKSLLACKRDRPPRDWPTNGGIVCLLISEGQVFNSNW